MAEIVRWGVLGNATIARVCVLPAICRSANGVLHALGTRFPDKAAEVAAANSIAHIYDSYEAVLADPAVDAVYIPLPNHLHHPWTLNALQAGKHVLCEKPLACNAVQAQEMAVAAQTAGLLLMEAFMYRFHPRSQRIKALVAAGAIGQPHLVRAAFCYHMSEKDWANPQNARLIAQMGGGALLDVGCYSVSVARWLMAAEPLHVQAQAAYHPDGVDVHLVGALRFADSGMATIEASFITALQQTYTVVGDKGAIELPHDAFIPWEKDTVYTLRNADQETGTCVTMAGTDEYRLMVEHFGNAVSGACEPAYTAAESLGNMQVLDGLAEAARTGRRIQLLTAA